MGEGLTYGVDKVVEGAVGEERLGQLSEEHLQGPRGHVDVLPLDVVKLHLFVCIDQSAAGKALDGGIRLVSLTEALSLIGALCQKGACPDSFR